MNKIIISFLAIAINVLPLTADEFNTNAFTPEFIRSLEKETRGKVIRFSPRNATDFCTAVYSCMDCYTTMVCGPDDKGHLVKIGTVTCPKDKPYCDERTGTCSTHKPPECAGNDNFICMGNRRYPDPVCYNFHACINYESLMLQCTYQNENYNPYTDSCQPGAECGSFDCENREGYKVAHSINPTFFAYCAKTNASTYGPLVIDSCPGRYQLNVTSQQCEAVCQYEGTLQDLEDCHYYFRCTNIYLTSTLKYMEKKRMMCPKGQGYSPKDFLCVDESEIDGCF